MLYIAYRVSHHTVIGVQHTHMYLLYILLGRLMLSSQQGGCCLSRDVLAPAYLHQFGGWSWQAAIMMHAGSGVS